MSAKFFTCKCCGDTVAIIKEACCTPSCCGKPMEEIIPGTVEAAVEKHIPEVSVDGGSVDVVVGAVEHPMIETHLIEWICLETEKGGQIKYLKAGEAPKASFAVTDDKAVAAYAYCNLHGLWKKEI